MARKGRARAWAKWSDPEAPFPSLGGEIVAWCEEYLVHGPGPVGGQPLRLHLDAERFTWEAYELERPDADGNTQRRYSEGLWIGPKGIAKTELLAAITCAEALGPVRFDGWDSSGEPVGRPQHYVDILHFANSEEQARDTAFVKVAYMLGPDTGRSELRRDYPGIDVGRDFRSSTRIFLPNWRGEITPMSASEASRDGASCTFIGYEETHRWTTAKVKDLYGVSRRALVKRRADGSWCMSATNKPDPSVASVASMTWTDHLAGVPDLVTFCRSLPEELVPPETTQDGTPFLLREQDDGYLEARLRCVYGSAVDFVQLPAVIAEIRRVSTDDGDARRLYLNEDSSSANRALTASQWRALSRPDAPPLQPGDPIAVGFDGARRRDTCGLVACRLTDKTFHKLKAWTRPRRAIDWWVPGEDVDAEVAATFERYRVTRFYADPPDWHEEIDGWARRHGTDRVARWETYRTKEMASALDRWLVAIREGRIGHVDDPQLTAHVLRSDLERTRHGWRLRKPEGVDDSLEESHIDLHVCAVLAHEAALDTPPGSWNRPPSSPRRGVA